MVEFFPLLSNSGNLLCTNLWERDHHITSNADVLLALPLSLSPLSILLCAVHFGLAVRQSHHEAVIKMEQDPNLRRLLTHDGEEGGRANRARILMSSKFGPGFDFQTWTCILRRIILFFGLVLL